MSDTDALIRELARRTVAAQRNTAMDHALTIYFVMIRFGHGKRGTSNALEHEWKRARSSALRAAEEGRCTPSDVPEAPPVLLVRADAIANRVRRVLEALERARKRVDEGEPLPIADLDSEGGLLVETIAEARPGRAVYRNTRGASFVLERAVVSGDGQYLNP